MKNKWNETETKQGKSPHKAIVRLLTLLLTLIWGIAWVFMKVSLDYMGPFTFSSLRFLSASLFLFIVLLFLKRLALKNIAIRDVMILGLLQTTTVFLLVTYGMKFVDAGKSAILLYTMPIWSGLLAAKFLDEPLTRTKRISMILGAFGLVFIFGFDLQNLNGSALIGQLLITLAAMGWAVANIFYQRKFSQADRLQVNAYQSLFGALGLTIAALIMENHLPIIISAASVFTVLYTGILASAISFTIWFFLLDVVDTATAAMSVLLVPIFGLLFGAFFLNEAMTINTIIGSLLILTGIVFTQFSFEKQHETNE